MADISIAVTQDADKADKVRYARLISGSFVTGGNNYRTGGVSCNAIHPHPMFILAWGGQYVWQYDPATNKLLAKKAKDTDVDTADGSTTAPDGKLIEETDETAMTETVQYIAFIPSKHGPEIEKTYYFRGMEETEDPSMAK